MPDDIIEGNDGTNPPVDQPGDNVDPNTPGEPAGTPPAGDTPAGDTPPEPAAGKLGDTPPQPPEYIEKDGVKYYKSFDTHPEWRELKDAKDAVKTIMDERGYLSMDELVAELNTGKTLGQLLGTSDAAVVQSMLDKAKKLEAYEDYWAEQEALKLKEGETQDETITRLENQLKTEKEARRADAQSWKDVQANETHVKAFNTDVGTLVDAAPELSAPAKGVLKLHLGVDNPMDEVDIRDRGTVRATAQQVISKFSEFLKGERQAAVDAYVAGKSNLTPTPKPDAVETPGVKKGIKVDAKGKSVEEAFGEANEVLTEALTKAWTSSQNV